MFYQHAIIARTIVFLSFKMGIYIFKIIKKVVFLTN